MEVADDASGGSFRFVVGKFVYETGDSAVDMCRCLSSHVRDCARSCVGCPLRLRDKEIRISAAKAIPRKKDQKGNFAPFTLVSCPPWHRGSGGNSRNEKKKGSSAVGQGSLPPSSIVVFPCPLGSVGETAEMGRRVTAVRHGVRPCSRTSVDPGCGDRRTPPRRGGASGHRVLVALRRVFGWVVHWMAGES